MEQIVLINKSLELLNNALNEAVTGRPTPAQAYLVKLRELLNAQPELEAGGDQRIEETLDPFDD